VSKENDSALSSVLFPTRGRSFTVTLKVLLSGELASLGSFGSPHIRKLILYVPVSPETDCATVPGWFPFRSMEAFCPAGNCQKVL